MRISSSNVEAWTGLEPTCRLSLTPDLTSLSAIRISGPGLSRIFIAFHVSALDTRRRCFAKKLRNRDNFISRGVENAEAAVVSVTFHNVENEAYYDFIWRSAIAAGVAAVVLFAYAAIRFKAGMGLSVLAAAVHDVLITLAVTALLRVPVGVAFIGVAAFSLLLSAFMNLMVFGKMRRDFRSDERKNLPAREGIALAVADSRKTVLVSAILLAAAIVVLGAVGAAFGAELLWFMLTGIIAVAASTYSSLYLAPALYACIKEKSDASRAEKAKYNYASEKKAKKEAKQVPVSETAEGNE